MDQQIDVLLIEDNPGDVVLLREYLAECNGACHLITAERLATGLQVLAEQQVAVVLLDLNLPDSQGLNTLRKLQSEVKGIPIVILTGADDNRAAIEAVRSGAQDYLVKGHGDPELLFRTLRYAIERQQWLADIEQHNQAIAASEQRLCDIINHNVDGIVVVNHAGIVQFVNPAAENMLGKSADKLLGEMFAFGVANDAVTELDIVRNHSSKPLIVEMRVSAIEWQGEAAHLLSLRDVTERKRAADAEHQQRVLAEALRDTASALISAFDLNAVMQTIIDNVARVVPYDAANIMLIEDGHAIPIYWNGYSLEQEEMISEFCLSLTEVTNLQQMFVTGAPFLAACTDEYLDWVSTPLTAWVKSYVAAPIRSQGNVIGFVNLDSRIPGFFKAQHAEYLQVFADQASVAIEQAQLHEQIRLDAVELEKRVEERTIQLSHAKERIETILNSSQDVIILCDTAALIDRVNAAFENIFGITAEKVAGLPLIQLAAPEQRSQFESAVSQVIQSGNAERFEISIRSQNGTILETDVALSPVIDPNGRVCGFVCSMRDITQRKQQEDQLRQMLEHETELSDLKSRFMSIAAHDLRNPLAVIQSSISMLEDYDDRLSDEMKKKKYDQIRAGINNMVSLLNDILMLGKAEAGKLQLTTEDTDVVGLFNSVINDFTHALGNGHTIDLRVTEIATPMKVDPRLIRHILTNLLSNAVKYSPAESIVQIELNGHANELTFRITDEGIGIPEDEQQHLFEAFFRASNVGANLGTGLGLSIVKQAVDAHNGTIKFNSQADIGTIFTVTIPTD